MDEWAELVRTLDTNVASGCAEVREDGEWLAELTGFRCELHRAGTSPSSRNGQAIELSLAGNPGHTHWLE